MFRIMLSYFDNFFHSNEKKSKIRRLFTYKDRYHAQYFVCEKSYSTFGKLFPNNSIRIRTFAFSNVKNMTFVTSLLMIFILVYSRCSVYNNIKRCYEHFFEREFFVAVKFVMFFCLKPCFRITVVSYYI